VTTAVIFDLDGTLVDSWRHHVRCLRDTMAECGLARPTVATLRLCQGATDRATLRRLLGAAAVPTAAAPTRTGAPVRESTVEDALCRYTAHAVRVVPGEVRPMAGADGVLAGLAARGIAAGVCTGRSRAVARALLDNAGIGLPLLVTDDDVPAAKPDPGGLLRAVAALSAGPTDAVYVGDTAFDARQGVGAGVPTVIVGPGAAAVARAWPVIAVSTLDDFGVRLGLSR
jgi:HAD superfamily hydrolase (TIGR01509 family)